MPSKSKKQHNLMALVANDPKAAKRLKIPQSVGKEFMKADKGKKFNRGGDIMSDTEIEKVIESNMKKSGNQKVKPKAPKTKTVKTPSGRDFTYETNPEIDAADRATEAAQKKYFKKGGSVKKHRGDGCVTKGRTKGKFV